ncbi:MAG: ribosome small subunit-dependent GTPase A [Chloroflexi bacterium 13_1_40CM_4_68_4]|nr:MAG: ribosome small subunit-dependent GTPase A [Chloroflexi bacterium 13_1_40CM_4_68_4]
MSLNPSELVELGWHPFFEEHFRPHAARGLAPARVAVQHRGAYLLYSETGELLAELAGRLQGDYVRHDPGKLGFEARVSGQLPAIGDWVAASVRVDEARATIRAVLPRRTRVSRKTAWSTTDEQVLAANMDTVFVVSALAAGAVVDDAASVRRLERFLAMAHESAAHPVVLLTKADLRDDARERALGLTQLGVDVVVTSSLTGEGLDELEPYLAPGKTSALLGSSGVGKSTLINTLLGVERLATRETRSDGMGRHTTMRRELIRLPGRGLIIDSPGLREIQLWDADDGLGGAFAEIDQLAAQCRFRDCRHTVEPGCAVRGAVETGALDASRLASFRRLQRELEHLEQKQDVRAAAERKHQYRALARSVRKLR